MQNPRFEPYGTRANDPDEHYNDAETGGQRNPLVSFPQSLENHLARSQGRNPFGGDISCLVELANTEFARASPDTFALALAPSFGFKGVVYEDLVKDVQVTETEHRLFGLKVGSSVRVITTTHQERHPRSYF